VSIEGPAFQPTDEADKYRAMWKHPQYRAVAPGEQVAGLFLEQAHPKPGSDVIDFGAGTGRGALMLAFLGGVKVRMLDFADNCLDPDVRESLTTQAHALCFAKQDLTDPIPWAAPYGFCTDVLEHIPPEQLDAVLTNILKSAQHVFFQVSCVPDACGALIGQPLHLSVHPYAWWLAKLRDEYECAIHWSKDCGDSCLFYVSAWWSGQQVTDQGVLNTEEAQVLANVRVNAARGLAQCEPYAAQDTEIMLLGGGPSLAAHLPDILRLAREGVKIVTLNGAYNWALDAGLHVSAQIIVDARPFNARFVTPPHAGCRYFLASQCDPSVYEALGPHAAIMQWHTSADFIRATLNDLLPVWYGVPGGSTVLLRAIPLMRMLGFKSFHLFGCDSCLTDERHHAYAQAENDGQLVIDTIIGGRVFRCHPWHVSQASEFIALIKHYGDEIQIDVHGTGLLAWILQHGYELDLAAEAAATG
jgi:hypothetical protein